MFNVFKRQSATDLIKEQLKEAELLALQHESATEYHQSMAKMYRDRIVRLRNEHVVTQKSS